MDVDWTIIAIIAATVACHFAVMQVVDRLGARWRNPRGPRADRTRQRRTRHAPAPEVDRR